jgi:hypothetical protein
VPALPEAASGLSYENTSGFCMPSTQSDWAGSTIFFGSKSIIRKELEKIPAIRRFFGSVFAFCVNYYVKIDPR